MEEVGDFIKECSQKSAVFTSCLPFLCLHLSSKYEARMHCVLWLSSLHVTVHACLHGGILRLYHGLTVYLFICLTFANIDNKNIVRTQDCRTTRQNDCTYGSPLKHINTKITTNIIEHKLETDKDQCTRDRRSMDFNEDLNLWKE